MFHIPLSCDILGDLRNEYMYVCMYCGHLEEANMTEAMSPTFLRTSACVITSVHNFFRWGPIVMKALGMCNA